MRITIDYKAFNLSHDVPHKSVEIEILFITSYVHEHCLMRGVHFNPHCRLINVFLPSIMPTKFFIKKELDDTIQL